MADPTESPALQFQALTAAEVAPWRQDRMTALYLSSLLAEVAQSKDRAVALAAQCKGNEAGVTAGFTRGIEFCIEMMFPRDPQKADEPDAPFTDFAARWSTREESK